MDSFKTVVSALLGKKIDYHHEMNAPLFEGWFQEKVLPSLPNKSAVVIDSACYNSRITEESKRPTSSWRKAAIQECLTEKGINFDIAKLDRH